MHVSIILYFSILDGCTDIDPQRDRINDLHAFKVHDHVDFYTVTVL